jgi:DNA-binding GntR family transcriptional regulator
MKAAAATQLEPGSSSALVETVVRHIDRMIGQGDLAPGDSVSEPALSAALGIGRVPVREAIRILAGEGLLELVPNRSARVRTVDATEILEMMEVLTGFSVLALHLLTLKPVPPELASALTASADKIQALAKSADSTAADLMHEISIFHYLIIKSSGNAYLLRLLRKTRMRYYSRFLVRILGRRAFVESAPRYGRMAAAILRGDAQAAIRIMLRDIENSKSHAKIG